MPVNVKHKSHKNRCVSKVFLCLSPRPAAIRPLSSFFARSRYYIYKVRRLFSIVEESINISLTFLRKN